MGAVGGWRKTEVSGGTVDENEREIQCSEEGERKNKGRSCLSIQT